MNMNVRQALQILNVGGGYIIKDIPYSAIKTAYRKQALLFHPDKNKSDDAQEVFIEIKTAFDVLTSLTN
jgi:DnaJ-class molecular chaperone